MSSWLQVLLNRRMIVALLMGFSSGLPLLLTINVLQAWMREDGVSLQLVGLVALCGLPYSLKFIWAPIFDRFQLPFLGRRRGWLLTMQLGLIVSVLFLSHIEPSETPVLLLIAGFIVAFFSASQDIIIDAYRREDLNHVELGPGSSFYLTGYRIGMVATSSGAFILADHIPFAWVYQLMAASLLIGVFTTLCVREPKQPHDLPHSFRQVVIEPLRDFMNRQHASLILLFILLYKLGDTLAAAMVTPLFLDLGFSKSEIGVTAQFFGFWATIGGGLVGAIFLARFGVLRCLWYFGILQMASTAGFILLAQNGHDLGWLSAVVGFENFTTGMATAAFITYLAGLTNKHYTAFQFALLTSLMGIPRVIFASPAGFLAAWIGWPQFFWLCTVLGIPGLILLFKLTKKPAH